MSFGIEAALKNHTATIDFGGELEIFEGLGRPLRDEAAKTYFCDVLEHAGQLERVGFSVASIGRRVDAAAGSDDEFLARLAGEMAEVASKSGGSVQGVNGFDAIDRDGFVNVSTLFPADFDRLMATARLLIAQDRCLLRNKLCDVLFWREALRYPADADLSFADHLATRQALREMPNYLEMAVLDEFRDDIPDRTFERIDAFAPDLATEWHSLVTHPRWNGQTPFPQI